MVGVFGPGTSLVVDAATFAASALIVRAWIHPRPAAAAPPPPVSSWLAGVSAGARIVLARPRCEHRWYSACWPPFTAPQRAWRRPLAGALGGGPAAVGVILAANSLGQTAGAIAFSRFVAPPTRLRLMGPLAISACAVLVLFFWKPDLSISLLILVVSGLCACLSTGSQRRLRGRGAARTAQPSLRPGPRHDEPEPGSSDDPGGGRSRTPLPGTGHRGMRRCRRRGSAGARAQRGPRSRPADEQGDQRVRSGPLVPRTAVLLPAGGRWAGRSATWCRARQVLTVRRRGRRRTGPLRSSAARRIISLSTHLDPFSN